ncbi:MAG: PA26 p53-induced protein-domain-containing protein [Benjaminiella poitrasii]|nr:MAG: PA26 p53-induced protein-domain-containing protein [Benjaminiella poitrasii]
MSQLWNQVDDQQIAETIRDSRASQLQSCRQRIALFKGLQIESLEERTLALEKIIQVVKSYIRSSSSSNNLSPSSSPNIIDSRNITTNLLQQEDEVLMDNEDEDENNLEYYNKQLFYYLLTILRLSLTCPYSDVRLTCKNLLGSLKKASSANSIAIPEPRYKSPSHFVSLHDIFSLESNTSSNQQQTVLYPRSTNLSFSPWFNNNNLYLQSNNLSQQSFNSSSSIPLTPTTPTTITTATTKDDNDFTGGRCSDEYVRQMMIKTFLDEGRLTNSFRILTFFPTFLEIYHITFTKIIKQPIGPLKRTWKAYLGIMVASEQRCQYLVSAMKIDFLYNGGGPDWLLGLDYVPNKLRMMSRFILKLARQPWRVTLEDVQQLISTTGNGSVSLAGDASWTRGELVQATVIIATFLGLSSFILGCGIAPEIDMTGGFVVPEYKISGIEQELDQPTIYLPLEDEGGFHTDHGSGLGVSTTTTTMTNTQKSTEELIHKLKLKRNETEEVRQQILESFGHPTNENSVAAVKITDEKVPEDSSQANLVFEDLSRFVDPHLNETISIEQFEKYHSEYNEFMLGEYCFEDHGCDLVNHYLPGLGDDLVAEFSEAISITDWSIFHPVAEEVVDTSPLRNAIWYYTLKIMGVTKEDYVYADIHTYLNDHTMSYIYDLCMSPQKIQMNDWSNIGISLRPEEKCHVNLLIASARKQAILCYGLCLISES